MDTATFFEKFSLFAQAEDAATRFREVVLNLAFSGKLKGTDLSGWETHPIGDFFTEGLKSINAPESPNQTYELWSVPSFETGAPEIVTGAQVGSTKRELRDGTILLGKINPHLNRIWVVNRRTNHPMIASQEWINVTAGDKWDTGYLARLLSSPSFNRSVCATAQGMGSLTRANTKQVAQIVVHCPPLKEQQKLIAKVDELMALCDRLEAQLKERDVKQAALAKAALAKFTEDPTPENLQLLFHPSYTIEPEDMRSCVRSLAVLGELTSNLNAEKRLGWQPSPLGSLCAFLNGDRSKNYPSKNTRVVSGVPFINAGHLSDGDVATDDMDYITEEHFNRLGGGKVQKGDVLYCLRGSLGKCAVVSSIERGAVASSLVILRPGSKLDANYLHLYLCSPAGRTLISKYDNGSAQPNLSAANVKKYLIELPPIEEQRRIVIRAKELISLVDELEAQIEASRTTGEKLLEAMVAELTSV